MTDIITFFDNNRKYAVYTGGNIHVIYRYLEIIGSPTTLTTSGKRPRYFGPSYYTSNDTQYIQIVIESLRIQQKLICEFFGSIGHKDGACIIRGPKLLPPILRINHNQFNTLTGEEPNDPLIYWNSQPTTYHFK